MSNPTLYRMKTKHVIILFLFLSLPFSYLNFSAYLKGGMPSIFQAFLSLLFIFLWFLCAFFMRHRNVGIKAASWYWGGGALLLALAFIGESVLLLPSILLTSVFVGPLYGLRYFLKIPPDFQLVFTYIIIAYGVCLIGWLFGKLRISRKIT